MTPTKEQTQSCYSKLEVNFINLEFKKVFGRKIRA